MALATNIPQRAFSLHNRDTLIAIGMTLLAAITYFSPDDPVTTVIIAGLPLGILLCVRAPLPICVLFIAFSFFRLHEAYPFLGGLKIPLMLGMLMFASLAAHVFLFKSMDPYLTPELKRVLVMFGIVVFGVVFAQERHIAWAYVVDVYWKVILLTFAIAWLTRTDRDFNFIGRTLVISGLLVAAVAIYNKFAGIGLVEGTRVSIARVTRLNADGDLEDAPAEFQSTLSDPNDLSLVLLFPLAFALSFLFYRSSRLNSFLGALGSVAILTAIIFTQSRGGLIGVLAVFGAIGFRLIKSRTVAITICVIAGLGLAAAMGLKGRVSGGAAEISTSSSGIDESAMGRIYAWTAAINMAVRRPLTGVGVNNFAPSYYFFTPVWENRDKAVHSTWFQVLGETGFPGIVAFMLMVLATCRSAWQSLNRQAAAKVSQVQSATALALVSGLAGFCAAGTFLTQAFTWPLYVMIGMTAAIAQASRSLPAPPVAPPKAKHSNHLQDPSRPAIRGFRPLG
jgi:putative inorganic carbon (hco3(-)) transporter